MLVVEEAQQAVLGEVGVLEPEKVRFHEALGRVLREDVRANRDIPEGDNTAMDGYAVLSADLASAPVVLKVIEDLPAGKVASKAVTPGTAIRIMTGALLPRGADAVVPVELTDAGSDAVTVHKSVEPGANIRRGGEDMRAGQIVLASGTRLGAAEIGVLASVQKTEVLVGRRPVVAILSTGDEIIEADAPMQPGKVVNSNSYSLAALVHEAGAVARPMGIIPDRREDTMRAIESALAADFIISTGGVSAGAYDFVKDALDALGAQTKFWQVAMKPGKPIVLSRLRDRLYFGLPGNPVSCMVSFLLFIAPSIRKAMGMTSGLFPASVSARLDAELKSRGDRRHYLRVRVVSRRGELVAIPMRAQGSGVSTSMVGANGFAVLDTGISGAPAGAAVSVVLIGPIDSE